VELVVVLTPPATHAGLTERLLAAGRHVVCEKPVAGDAAGAARLFAMAADADLMLLAARSCN
jgi:predicted dehydrogenase